MIPYQIVLPVMSSSFSASASAAYFTEYYAYAEYAEYSYSSSSSASTSTACVLLNCLCNKTISEPTKNVLTISKIHFSKIVTLLIGVHCMHQLVLEQFIPCFGKTTRDAQSSYQLKKGDSQMSLCVPVVDSGPISASKNSAQIVEIFTCANS